MRGWTAGYRPTMSTLPAEQPDPEDAPVDDPFDNPDAEPIHDLPPGTDPEPTR